MAGLVLCNTDLATMRICLRMGLMQFSANHRNDRKKFVSVRKHSWGVHKHSRGLAKISNMLLKFAKKHIRNIYVSNHKPFVVTVRRL